MTSEKHCIIVGGMKCGTTGLFSWLRRHPDISACRIKEPNFFVSSDAFQGNWDKGLGWYYNYFPQSRGIKLEASTAYSKLLNNEQVVRRIASSLPSVKLIYLVRDPAVRAVSHYLHNAIKGTETREMRHALLSAELNSYHFVSLYSMHITQFLSTFTRSDFKVWASESLWKEPATVLSEVTTFLNIPSDPMVGSLLPRNETLKRIYSLGSIHKRTSIQDKLYEIAILMNLKPGTSSTALASILGFDHKDFEELRERFRDDISRLQETYPAITSSWENYQIR